MFKIEKDPRFWAEVKVAVPTDDGHAEHTFRARYRVRPAEVVEQVDRFDAGMTVKDFLKETVVDLSDIQDGDGEPAAFSAELLDTVLGHYGARLALWNTYIAAVTKARVGN